MAEGQRFVIVEFVQPDTPFGAFTMAHPGSVVDLIGEPPVVEGDDLVQPSMVLVKGAPPDAVEALLQRLSRLDDIEVVEADAPRRSWLLRMRIHATTTVHSPGSQVVLQFQHRLGAPWTHVEQGVVHLRARVPDPAQAELLADQMRRYFAKSGVDAQVEVREISRKDYGAWEELVQRAIGLAP